MTKRTKRTRRLVFLVFRICIYLTILATLAQMLLTSRLQQLRRFSRRRYIAAKILIHITGVLLMLTSVFFLLCLNPSYAKVAILLLPVMAIGILIFYNGINTGQAREVAEYGAHQPKLKEFFDLSASVTAAAFGALMATILGFFKNVPQDIDQIDHVKLTEAFILFTVISGLLMMQLTTVPPSLPHANAREKYIAFIEVLIFPLSGLLGLTGLAVAARFLKEYILPAFFPVLFAFVVWFRREFIEEHGNRAIGHESEPDTTSIAITMFIFAALMGVYSVYFGNIDSNFHLKTCIFLLSLAFVSSLIWMLLTFRPRGRNSLGMAVMTLTYSTFIWLVFAVLDLISLEILTDYHKRQH